MIHSVACQHKRVVALGMPGEPDVEPHTPLSDAMALVHRRLCQIGSAHSWARWEASRSLTPQGIVQISGKVGGTLNFALDWVEHVVYVQDYSLYEAKQKFCRLSGPEFDHMCRTWSVGRWAYLQADGLDGWYSHASSIAALELFEARPFTEEFQRLPIPGRGKQQCFQRFLETWRARHGGLPSITQPILGIGIVPHKTKPLLALRTGDGDLGTPTTLYIPFGVDPQAFEFVQKSFPETMSAARALMPRLGKEREATRQ